MRARLQARTMSNIRPSKIASMEKIFAGHEPHNLGVCFGEEVSFLAGRQALRHRQVLLLLLEMVCGRVHSKVWISLLVGIYLDEKDEGA